MQENNAIEIAFPEIFNDLLTKAGKIRFLVYQFLSSIL